MRRIFLLSLLSLFALLIVACGGGEESAEVVEPTIAPTEVVAEEAEPVIDAPSGPFTQVSDVASTGRVQLLNAFTDW